MSEKKPRLLIATFVLAILSTVLLIFNLPALALFRREIFLARESLSGVGIVIGAGFLCVALFNFVSVVWRFTGLSDYEDKKTGRIVMAMLGILCIVLLFGEKTMIDEIGKQYLMNWNSQGEWAILYIFLSIQLTYNLLTLFKLIKSYQSRQLENCPDMC